MHHRVAGEALLPQKVPSKIASGGGTKLFSISRHCYLPVHTLVAHTLKHMRVCQLTIANCSSHQPLAAWPPVGRGEALVSIEVSQTHRLSKSGSHSSICICTRLPVCKLSASPSIHRGPPSNEDEKKAVVAALRQAECHTMRSGPSLFLILLGIWLMCRPLPVASCLRFLLSACKLHLCLIRRLCI